MACEPASEVDGTCAAAAFAEANEDQLDMSVSTVVPLPRQVRIAEFARHRARELATLTSCVGSSGGGKRIFQQLPRHMRRRAQSYNVRRVPRRIQEAHRRELEKAVSNLPAKKPKKKASSRPPSRRHRRRSRQLLLDYNRRQRQFVWLETHVWHAKRFRMCPRWGYKVALSPCDKSIRACYRGSTRAALIMDISYTCCIEISGDRQKIVEILRQMTSAKCGLTFESMRHDAGECEGSVVLYRRNSYPHAALGEAKFMWRPTDRASVATMIGHDHSSCKRRLWIWVHPACHEEVLSELIGGFKLEKITEEEEEEEDQHGEPNEHRDYDEASEGDVHASQKRRSSILMLKDKAFLKLNSKLLPFYEGTPLYASSDQVNVKVLKDNLVRFRLAGQMSTAILTDVLRVELTKKDLQPADNVHRLGDDFMLRWWHNPTKLHPTTFSQQFDFWNAVCKSPFSGLFPPGSIFGLTVCDPRESMRSVDRSKVVPNVPDVCRWEPLRFPSGVSDSPLWDQDTRDDVTFTKITDHDINTLRSQNLVPGTPSNLGDRGSRIPVILIQNPGNQNSEVGVGWDVILPAGWAMSFWISLVYRNVRVGGLRETAALAHQSQTLHFPDDFPDTPACQRDEADVRSQLTTKYFAYPPDKRPNYIKLGVAAPFHSPWGILTEEWAKLTFDSAVNEQSKANEEGNFFVMRERRVLRLLQGALHVDKRGGVDKKKLRRPTTQPTHDIQLASIVTLCNAHSLVAIHVKMLTKGRISEFALICIPNEDDLRELAANSRFCGPREPTHADVTKTRRNKIQKESSRKKRKSLFSETDALTSQVRASLKKAETLKRQEQMQMLCIPPVDRIVKTCSRDVLGFVKCGGFSYSEGCVAGLAFVSLPGLLNMILKVPVGCNSKVLVRQTNSDQYRFATFSVLV